MPVVVKPHRAHGLEAHESTQKSTDKRHERTKVWDCARDDVRYDHDATSRAEPGDPVRDGVGRDVSGSAEQPDEKVLGGQLDTGSA